MSIRQIWLPLLNLMMFGLIVAVLLWTQEQDNTVAPPEADALPEVESSEPVDEMAGMDLAEIGQLIYAENCFECHLDGNDGKSGDIRGSDYRTVSKATTGYEKMPEFEFEKDELEAIVEYLDTL